MLVAIFSVPQTIFYKIAMQSILYMDFGREPLMKMPNIKLFSEASYI